MLYKTLPCLLLSLAMGLATSSSSAQDKRDTMVINDRSTMRDSQLWIYNDVKEGFALARKTGKPLLIVFR
ncbi:MAG: hypothetical protein QF412_03635 [Planctomycetota bacterium]|jgi:hypothetical protein|nr:hypothetical protein [Planctomycetota bacterium]